MLQFSIAQTFSKAIQVDGNDAVYYFNRGFCNGMLGRTKEAFDDFEVAAKLDAEPPYLYAARDKIYLKIGKHEKACGDFEKARTLGLVVPDFDSTCINKIND